LSFSFRPNWSETQLPSNQVAKRPGIKEMTSSPIVLIMVLL
jgi:hypothetical protein